MKLILDKARIKYREGIGNCLTKEVELDPSKTYIIHEGKMRDVTELIAVTDDGCHYIPAVIEIESLPEVK